MADNSGKIKWMNVVLFFSLALNFFIAGYLVSDTRVFKGLHIKKVMHKRPAIKIVDYFPSAEKKEFRRLIFEHRENIKLVKMDIFNNQKEIFEIISKPEVEERKLRAAFQKYQNTNDQLQTTINDIVVGMVLKMDYETRLTIIKRGNRAHIRRQKMGERR